MLYLFEPESPINSLVGALPPLVCRLDHKALASVTPALGEFNPQASDLGDELAHPDEHLAAQHILWRRLMRVFDDENRRLAEGRQRIRRFSDQYFAQVPGRARTEILLNQLSADATSIWKRWGDHRAVDRYLDVETYLERHARKESEVSARVRLTLFAAEYLSADMMNRATEEDRPALAAALLADIGADALLTVAGSRDFPDLAWLATRAAKALLIPLMKDGSVPGQWLTLMLRISSSKTIWSWHRRTAHEIMAHDAESGRNLLFNRLMRRDDPSHDDWHVRAHCADLLVTIHPGADTWSGLEEFVEAEPSDGVLFQLCDALGRREESESIALLNRLGQEPFVPKVRACAAKNLALMGARGGDASRRAIEHLSELIDLEDNDTALRIMTARMEWVLTRQESGGDETKQGLREMLAPRLETEDDAALANALTNFRQSLVREQVGEVTDLLDALPYGKGAWIEGELSESDLGMAMAIAARDGYGLYARRRFGRWRVRRGEGFRTRPWRVFHELRNPAPNKRQGYQHTRARIFPGNLRAHPTHMGELTPTAVPGERKQVGAEGGWAPYLPHVDDVLDAQFSRKPIRIFTAVGVTELTAPRTGIARLRAYFKVSWTYAALDDMRQASILGADDQERGRFLGFVESEFGTSVTFRPYFEDDPVPPHVRSLIASTKAADALPALQVRPKMLEGAAMVPIVATSFAERIGLFINSSEQVLSRTSAALFERAGVRIQDLGFVIVALFALFLGRMLWARHTIDIARKGIPLSVGGWGTRGKSGTERLKAGMFHGMGYDVFVKTTGCEAMYIHAPRGAEAREIFLYRPYDKASIWEQSDMLQMGYQMSSDVFLWECMALNPRYVEILQAGWMRDDIVTLTNAYPDHEDIQGPAGVDVAATIGRFLPKNLTAITAEREMLPIFEQVSIEKNTNLIVVNEEDEFLIPDDSLIRFPYSEHPRNISMVARMASELGIEPEFATFMMADKVVPDLGVLKVYPEVNIHGRHLKFINGCSANERAGFMNNWQRMELSGVGPHRDHKRRVATVVNNRGDRVSRSMVFADILVRDVAVDRHILIGTNLSGLRIYFTETLDRYLANVVVVDEDNQDADQSRRRLTDLMNRCRVFDTAEDDLIMELNHMLTVHPSDWAADDGFAKKLSGVMAGWVETFKDYDVLYDALPDDPFMKELATTLESHKTAEPEDSPVIQGLGYCETSDIIKHWSERIACVVTSRALHAELDEFLEKPTSTTAYHERVRKVWRQRFWHTIYSIDDSEISGDGIILEAARTMPPGCHIDLMGTQNIKGTGLDFVYRWVDLNTTMLRVNKLKTADDQALNDELLWLSSAAQFGLTEALASWRALGQLKDVRKLTPRELGLIERTQTHLEQLVLERLRDVSDGASDGEDGSRFLPLLFALEKWLDPLDAVSRRIRSEAFMRELANERISHTRMSYEMQKLTKRQKGGWFVSRFKS